MHGGEVFVSKILSMQVIDIVEAVAPGCRIEVTGIRPGEKVHEVLIAEDESRAALEFDDMYLITPMFQWWGGEGWQDGKPLPEGFRFASETNTQWISQAELQGLMGESTNG